MSTTTLSGQTKLKRITDPKMVNALAYLCMIVYFISYITRLNYGAVVSELVAAEGIAKEAASFAVTGLFITYGVGQLISGWLGDRLPPKYLMFGGLVLSTVMNLLLPLSTNVAYMTIVWCINGFGQALMWPPIVKIMTTYMSSDDYVKSTVKVSWGSSCGTIAIYLLAPLFIKVSGWRSLFYFCAVCGVAGALISLFGITKIEKYAEKHGKEIIYEDNSGSESPEKKSKTGMHGGIASLIAVIMFAIILQGTLRDGVTTWMPSYIGETFNLGTSVSILTGVILPIFSLICINASKAIYSKLVSNELTLSGIIFAVSAAASAVLALFSSASPVVSVACSTVIVACMHGVNLMLICVVPKHFKKTGNISTISGLLNFATYVGAAISTYVFAALSEIVGWHGTIVLWAAISICGAAVCLIIAKSWSKFTKEH